MILLAERFTVIRYDKPGCGLSDRDGIDLSFDGQVAAAGQYLKSTQMPGDIDPGQTQTGWLYVPLDPSELRSGRTLQLTFHDVAVDGYRTVGDIVIAIPVDGQFSV